jgi:large subunit ribosomal protein L30
VVDIDIKMESKQETKKTEKDKPSLTIIIRISGLVKVNRDIEEALDRLKLRRKYAAVLINSNDKNIKGMLDKVKFFVAYGEIDKPTLIKLLKSRAKSIKGEKVEVKIDAEKVAGEIISGKDLRDLGLKPFFRLHPPRKGIKSKIQYPKGVLGNNKKDINKLVERML